ncbi:MAG: ribosome-binding factor A [Isosphaeraceae bacterium]
MKDHIISRKTMARLCAEPSPDDGLDPHSRSRIMPGDRHLHGRPQEGPDRKALQLCHQVAETLEEVLAECGDVVLQALRVLDVEPAPDASRLLVTVAVDAPPEAVLDPCSVHDHLVRASGHLRSEVAGAITRKRAPVLVYRLAANPNACCY